MVYSMGASEELRRSRIPGEVGAMETSWSAEKVRQLLERVALLVRPGEGGATLLFTLGRIASSERWLDAGFVVEINGDDKASIVEIFSEDDSRAPVVESTVFALPIHELVKVLDADPEIIGSLRAVVDAHKHKIVMRTTRVSGAVPAR